MSHSSDNPRLRKVIAAVQQRWAGSTPRSKSWQLGYAAHHFVYREARYDQVTDEVMFVRDRRGRRYGPALAEARRVWGEVDEAEFFAGWEAKPGRVDKIAKAISLLQTTKNPKGDNTARSQRRRAWRDLDEIQIGDFCTSLVIKLFWQSASTHTAGYRPAQLNGDDMGKKATSVRLSPELLRRVREMIAATREAASVTEAIEIALEDWLEDREAELEARGLPSPNGPVSDLPGPVQLGPSRAKAEAVAWWQKAHPEQAATMLFRAEVDWRAMDPRAAELYDMLSRLYRSD